MTDRLTFNLKLGGEDTSYLASEAMRAFNIGVLGIIHKPLSPNLRGGWPSGLYSLRQVTEVKVDVGSKSKNGAANLNLCLLSSYSAKCQFWLIILQMYLFCSIFMQKKFKIQKGVAAITMETERMKNV